MDVAEVLMELVRRAERNESDGHTSLEDLARWIAATGLSEAALLDAVALQLARKFDERALSFEIADDVANTLHAFVTLEDASRPDLFHRVFCAFDEGEYYHDAEQLEDPELAYTRPQIKEILAGLPTPPAQPSPAGSTPGGASHVPPGPR